MSIIQGHAKSSGVTEFYPTTIDQSLRFEDGDNAYLNWTPASAGNRKTWTWSGWVKRGNIPNDTSQFVLFSAGSQGGDVILFSDGNKFNVNIGRLGIGTGVIPEQVQRDGSAWYHFVASIDTTQATAADRVKIYVNGVQVTAFSTATYPSQNADTTINNTTEHALGRRGAIPQLGLPAGNYFDGYLAEVHFTDGTAYTADDFGELKSGIWIPKAPSVTYGTNGFYLPFNEDVTVEGFNTVTWRGNNNSRSVTGVGFQPDFVWIKNRSDAWDHVLVDSIRGGSAVLSSKDTDAEVDPNPRGYVTSFDSDGFSLTNGSSGDEQVNDSGDNYVAWCWDAGSGSPVSNTNGSITSTVKANTAYGFSIVSYAGNATSGATIGHGLNQAPEFIVCKNRGSTSGWTVYVSELGATKYLGLNVTDAEATNSRAWNNTAPTSSVFTVGDFTSVNGNSDIIAYCFHSVSGYSDFGSYTGNGQADDNGPAVTTGFKPALVIYKQSSGTGNWSMVDNTRSPEPVADNLLNPNLSNAENTSDEWIKFTDTGFQVRNTHSDQNANGATYIYMAFADTRDAAFWLDESGNDNDWTPNSLEHSDVVPDSPTNNFAVLNSVNKDSVVATSEGNLKAVCSAANQGSVFGTFAPQTGKWYWEVLIDANKRGVYGYADATGSNRTGLQIGTSSTTLDRLEDGTATSVTGDASTGSILAFAFDMDAKSFTVYLNGASLTTGTYSNTEDMIPFFRDNSGSAFTTTVNFGQDSTFAGNKSVGGNSDANGIGDFAYAPPSGYLALCTSNLPDPVIDPAQDATPEDNFSTLLYTGDGSYPRSITGVGFQPDFTWIKARSAAGYSHVLYDAVRGAGLGNELVSNTTGAEGSIQAYANLTSFDSDGFSVGSTTQTNVLNGSGVSHVAWNWKAGGIGVSNTDGSITSTVSANTDAGFSIVGYTGNGTAGATVGHGLSSAPEVVIIKQRTTNAYNWVFGSDALTSWAYILKLNLTDAEDGSAGPQSCFNSTAPTSTVFTVGTSIATNNNTDNFIAYCFHSVDGFSKVGSYVGNGLFDGPFVYTGFRPKWVMIKVSSSAGQNWVIYDSERNTYNVMGKQLYPNLSNAEADGGTTTTNAILDFTSNGFKLRGSHISTNYSTRTIIYLAFAEQPFKYSNAR